MFYDDVLYLGHSNNFNNSQNACVLHIILLYTDSKSNPQQKPNSEQRPNSKLPPKKVSLSK